MCGLCGSTTQRSTTSTVWLSQLLDQILKKYLQIEGEREREKRGEQADYGLFVKALKLLELFCCCSPFPSKIY